MACVCGGPRGLRILRRRLFTTHVFSNDLRWGSAFVRRDPLTAILGRGERPATFYTGVSLALGVHVAILLLANILALFGEMRVAVASARSRLHDYYWTQYEVDVAIKPKIDDPKPPEETAPPPEPKPVAAPPPKSPAKIKDDPYDQPPPTPAQAAKVLTAREDPDDVKDLTGNTVVSGDGTASYGQQSASGTGDRPTMNPPRP